MARFAPQFAAGLERGAPRRARPQRQAASSNCVLWSQIPLHQAMVSPGSDPGLAACAHRQRRKTIARRGGSAHRRCCCMVFTLIITTSMGSFAACGMTNTLLSVKGLSSQKNTVTELTDSTMQTRTGGRTRLRVRWSAPSRNRSMANSESPLSECALVGSDRRGRFPDSTQEQVISLFPSSVMS